MSDIKLLEKQVVQKIAAGEVVVAPYSVLKELIENSIDAGSKKINVVIKGGGKKYIHVEDDGEGIDESQVELAFTKNATSKIEDIDSLSNISTLGFRGEALFSISVVSNVEIITKTNNMLSAIKAKINKGVVTQKENVPSNRGTKITVTDLFYNVPARYRNMKSERKEALSCVDLVSKLAISNPNISFSMISDDKNLFVTSGDGNIRNTITSILGKEYTKQMIDVDYEDYPVTVKGVTLSANYIDKQIEESIIIINGRYVKCPAISKGISQVYKDEYGKFSKKISYVLYITLPLNMTDVNVHPSKTVISFRSETLIVMLICEAIKESLYSFINLGETPVNKGDVSLSKENKKVIEDGKQSVIDQVKSYVLEDKDLFINSQDNISYDTKGEYVKERAVKDDTIIIDDNDELYKEFVRRKEILSNEVQAEEQNEFKKSIIDTSVFDKIMTMKFCGMVFNAYAMFEMGEELYIIDTHAAHERVLYDEFLKKYKDNRLNMQPLLNAIILDVSVLEKDLCVNNIDIFKKLGFEIDEFSKNSIVIRQIPSDFDLSSAKDVVLSILDALKKNIFDVETNRDEILIKCACHSAVRGKDFVDYEGVIEILKRLKNTTNPFTCPHSRPTVSKIYKKYFLKMFKRV